MQADGDVRDQDKQARLTGPQMERVGRNRGERQGLT